MTLQATPSDFWFGRAVVVTGAAGFVGGWTARALIDRGANVVLLARNWGNGSVVLDEHYRHQATLVAADMRDRASIERAFAGRAVDVVIHLASCATVSAARDRPLDAFGTNAMGTANLLEICRVRAVPPRLIVASSAGAYRTAGATLPFDESSPLDAVSPYEASKLCADVAARSYAATFRLPVCVTRSANVYGPGDLAWTRLVPATIRAVLRGERPIIRSDGTPLRDYLFVEDCVRAHLRLAEAMDDESLHGLAFNVASERPRSVLDMVRAVCHAAGRPDLEPEIRNDCNGAPAAAWSSARLARQRLGWSAEVDVPEGLRRALEWYRDREDLGRGRSI